MKKPRPKEPEGKNHVWAWDFVHDSCANGQVLKFLTVVDEFTCESLAIEVAGSIRAADAIKTLGRLIASHGAPAVLRSDNGPEFVVHKLAEWLEEEGIETAFIQPGRPWQNGTNESFNGKFRDGNLPTLSCLPQLMHLVSTDRATARRTGNEKKCRP